MLKNPTRWLLGAIAAAITALPAAAQSDALKAYIDGNIQRAGVNCAPYEYTAAPDTKAPFGYKEVYISHFGRHGARSSWERTSYTRLVFGLQNARLQGLLTPDGEYLLECARRVMEAHNDMDGKLTQLGEQEQQQIARRFYKRNRRFLKHTKGGVRAVSSTVQRCIRTMGAFNLELNELCPRLEFSTDCGYYPQKFMNSEGTPENKARVRKLRDSLAASPYIPTEELLARVFTDPQKGAQIIGDPHKFVYDVYQTARIAPSFQLKDCDIFRVLPREVTYKMASIALIYFYMGQANSKEYGQSRMTLTLPLVLDVVQKADAVLAGRDQTAVDLRFGHDFPFIALCAYLRLEGLGEQMSCKQAMESFDGRFECPFSCNLQMAFYRSRAKGKPVLVKFLVNEKETRIIGLEPDAKGIFYDWEKVKQMLRENTPVQYLGPLYGRAINPKNNNHEGYQGLDIYGDYAVSAQNRGTACVYRFEGDLYTKVGEFKFGSWDEHNHSNVLSFLPVKYNEADPLPLLSVSRAQKGVVNGLKDELYIERIAPGFDGSEVVRVINYVDRKSDFGYALQWVVDTENNFLYGYGNTVSNEGEGNCHRIIKFALPDVLAEGPRMINLHREDALENYLLEDYITEPFSPIGQGLFVRGGKLYMPTGFGTEKHPSMLYTWDLNEHTLQETDLTLTTFSELEDCGWHNGGLVIQSQKGFWKIPME